MSDDGVRRRRRASMREVADKAGVAMSSVSRVLSGHPDVSPAMSARVLAAVAELDYQPDILAQSLRRRETLTVGFVVGDISNPLFAEIVTGVESTLHTNGYSMLLTNSLGDPQMETAHIRLLTQRRVDGLVISVLDETHTETIGRLRELDIPVVVLDRNLPADIPVSRVLSDHRSGMKAAVLHLLDLGHRRIALIGGTAARPAVERRAGLAEAFELRGLPSSYIVDEGSFAVEHGAAAMRRLLDLPEPPTAVIAGGNQVMFGALRVVAERRVSLGSELSFVGCDDVAITDLFRPAVAVVRRDTFAMGRTAAELLLGRMRDGASPSDVVLPTEFVARPSCGPPQR
ncbi:MAG: LacI family DNA-binding transcriptional regulator [Gaiella sp.]